jgi:acetylornithine/N-succinyldiaminopimelate aminotransferase
LASALPIADARVLLCDSGGEAVELATALGRAYGRASGRTKVVAFDGATVAPGADVVRVPRGDLASMDAALDGSVAAVLVDAVAVHDGVRPLDAAYLRELRRMTRERGCALLADEVVGGVGRCGDWLAISAAGVVPDAAALGSGLGGGIAIGAVVASDALSESVGELRPTAAGSPVACAAAVAVVDAIVDEQLLDNAVEQGDRLRGELQAMAERSALVGKVRGRGVLLGISLRRHAAHEFVLSLLAEGVLTTEVAPDEIVMSPPLVVGPDDIDAAIGAVASVLDSLDVGARA